MSSQLPKGVSATELREWPVYGESGQWQRPAADAIEQEVGLSRFIEERAKDHLISRQDEEAIVAYAQSGGIQDAELSTLRKLTQDPELQQGTQQLFMREVDRLFPAGPPTSAIATIRFRLETNVGREQLLTVLEHSKNPVQGGPKTFVIQGLGAPYLAAITTGQVMLSLVHFLQGASSKQATQIRTYLTQQLRAVETPCSQGGLATQGITKTGIAVCDDTREPSVVAINQQAVLLQALGTVADLKGSENAKLAAQAKALQTRVARELKADLDFAYSMKSPFSYSFQMIRDSATGKYRPSTVQLEDGQHLQTTLIALKHVPEFNRLFKAAIQRIETRYPAVPVAGPQDLTGDSGHIYTPEFLAFCRASLRAEKKRPTTGELAKLREDAASDHFITDGERTLLENFAQRVEKSGTVQSKSAKRRLQQLVTFGQQPPPQKSVRPGALAQVAQHFLRLSHQVLGSFW